MKLKSIFKKSIRSIVRNKSAYMACVLVLSLGILVYIAMMSILSQVQNGILSYYEANRFGDAFATVAAMPKSNLKKLEAIEGIKAADGNLSKTVKANVGNPDEIITVKLIGIDVDNEKKINQYTYEGENLKYNNDIWLGKSFFNAHGFQNGDIIPLLINGKEENFIVRGIVESPEYVTVMSDTALVPDERTYTIGFMKTEALESYTSMYGIATDISFLLEDGIKYEDVEQSLDDALAKYGLRNLVSRKDQKSNYLISDDINQMAALGTLLPTIFLIITFIMLYIMLKRLIEQERGEIGTLKAFGYTSFEIIMGYMIYGVIVGMLGFLLGLALCSPFGVQMYATYKSMYSLPDPNFMVSKTICLYALAISLFVSIFSILISARSVLRIRPAEAMRSEAPKIKNSKMNFHDRFFNILFNKSGIMALRSIMRNKTRSGLIVISIVSAFAIINVIYAMGIACNDTVMKQPQLVEFYDIKAGLNTIEPMSGVLNETKKIDGVLYAEGILTIPVQLTHKNLKEDVLIYGMHEGSSFYKIRGTDDAYYEPSKNGLILNTKIAEKLNVRVNDTIEIKSLYLNETIKVIVVDVIEEAIGPGCYMEIEALSRMFYGDLLTNNILIRADGDKISDIQRELTNFPNISSITNQERTQEVNKEMLKSVLVMVYSFIFMSFFMGFGAIYNVSRISLAEKMRELATMRILGYRVDETAAMNSFEQWLMLMVGIIIGFIPANLLKGYIASLFSNDYYTLSVKISPESTMVAVFCCILAVLLSNMSAKREIRGYDLAEVLKERE